MDDDTEPWFRGKTFTTDWLSTKPKVWFKLLARLRDRPCRILEVGAFEGRSVVVFLEFLPKAHVTAIDLFPFQEIEDRFDRNVAGYGDRITKLKGNAALILDELANPGSTWSATQAVRAGSELEGFDVIYLDAAKTRQDAFAHSVLAWPLLKVGGVIIWDDFLWKPQLADAERPAPGIALFLKTFAPCLKQLHDGYQVIAEKTAEWPVPALQS